MALTDNLEAGLYSHFKTSKGDFLCELFYEASPLTVLNFAGLAEGVLSSTRKGKFYNGLTFHRVVDNFVIQGGDPQGNGTGGPGYKFNDEFASALLFSKAGILAMANSGANTNGSQFFITLAPTPHLNQKHTIFGEIVAGMEVVRAIKEQDRIEELTIIRKGPSAEEFLLTQEHFDKLQKESASSSDKLIEQRTEQALEFCKHKWSGFKASKDANGISSHILAEGAGGFPPISSELTVHYRLHSLDEAGNDNIIDDSYVRGAALSSTTDKLIAGWGLLLSQMRCGEKRIAIIPPDLAYGARGVPPSIEANAVLIFEMELISYKD